MRVDKAVCFAAIAFCGTLSAGPVIWNLNSVQLADGTAVMGSFTINVDADILSNLTITTSGGSSVPSNSSWTLYPGPPFGGWVSSPAVTLIALVDSSSNDLTGVEWMDLDATAPQVFTDTGGVVQIGLAQAGVCTDSICDSGPATVKSGSGQFVGAASPAPEPGSLLLAGSALTLLARLLRKQRRKKR